MKLLKFERILLSQSKRKHLLLVATRKSVSSFKHEFKPSLNKPNSLNQIYFADKIDPNESKFGKVLIANRGEIACRIIRTCRAMGVKTVAIYSEIDSRSVHVQQADESYCVGAAPSRESYLNVAAIVEAIRQSGAEAVHPGYGFLSENTAFAKQLHDLGVAFIGPNAASIRAMGDKIESKLIARKAGVNTIPGYDGTVRDAEHCVELARQIGYPVMIKASAGGGGKGMRIAANDDEVFDGYRFSKDEAASSFNDDRLLIEKFIEDPRHIEVQVLCDQHGNGIFLNERECSIQRRNQKVIEEAPSTFVDPDLRAAMGKQAVELAHNVGYDSAGTVEFLVDKHKNFYFLEMNTRLQVEHPITEYITGIDLVHQMLRIAKGHPLKHAQKDVQIRGWAFESRVYAENPYKKNFGLPSVGRLTRYQEPVHIPNVRCDSGVQEGSEISIYYDPMICKLISFGETRTEALGTMKDALDSYVIRGLTHNIPLLRDILTEPNFVSGNVSTNYLPAIYGERFRGRRMTSKEQVYQLASIACAIYLREEARSKGCSSLQTLNSIPNYFERRFPYTDAPMHPVPGQFQHLSQAKPTANLFIDFSGNDNLSLQDMLPARVRVRGDKYLVQVNGGDYEVEMPKELSLGAMTLEIPIDGEKQIVQIISIDGDGRLSIQFEGTVFQVRILDDKTVKYMKRMPVKQKVDSSKIIQSPLFGLVKSVSCQIGDQVNEEQELCVIEAMKMAISIMATSSGKVCEINCKVGDTVNGDQVLVQLQ